jgi:hypothetical protein
MHTAWLTLICVAGIGQLPVDANPEGPSAPAQCCPGPPRDPGETCYKALTGWLTDWFLPMPQTCYSPHFGCYPGNGRDIQRYPAFHGSYYRRAYNYRQLYEWPWLADPHDPGGCTQPCCAQMAGPPMGQPMTAPFAHERPFSSATPTPAPTSPAPAAVPAFRAPGTSAPEFPLPGLPASDVPSPPAETK